MSCLINAVTVWKAHSKYIIMRAHNVTICVRTKPAKCGNTQRFFYDTASFYFMSLYKFMYVVCACKAKHVIQIAFIAF